jgi:hypothetical protein
MPHGTVSTSVASACQHRLHASSNTPPISTTDISVPPPRKLIA